MLLCDAEEATSDGQPTRRHVRDVPSRSTEAVSYAALVLRRFSKFARSASGGIGVACAV